MRKTLSIAVAVGMLASTSAQGQDATVYRPSSAWAADYGDDYCRLLRTFSDGTNEVTIALQRLQPGGDTQLMLIGNSLRTFRGADQLGWNFLPDQASRNMPYTRSEAAGQQVLMIQNVSLVPAAPLAPGTPPGPPRYDRAAEATVSQRMTGLAVGSGLTKPVRIETGRLDGPVGALQTCTDDLLKTWGIDPAKHQNVTPAVPQIGADGWLPQGTIPMGDFGKFAGGANQVRLMLDAAGKATGCHIVAPSLGEALNTRICTLLMEKATFTPAKDGSGTAVASYWFGSPMFLGPPMRGGRR